MKQKEKEALERSRKREEQLEEIRKEGERRREELRKLHEPSQSKEVKIEVTESVQVETKGVQFSLCRIKDVP